MLDDPGGLARASTPGGPPLARRASLRLRLQILLAGLIGLVAGTLLVAAGLSMMSALLRSGEARAQSASRRVASVLAQSATRSRELVGAVAAKPEVVGMLDGTSPVDAGSAALAGLESATPRRVSMWTADGRHVLERALPGAPAAATRVEALPPADSLPPPGMGVIVESNGVIFSDVTVPVTSAQHDGVTVGWLSVRAPILLNPPGILRQLVGDDATILLGSRSGGAWTDFERIVDAPPPEDGRFVRDGRRAVGGATAVEGTPWHVWVELPQSVVTSPATSFMLRLGLLVLALSAVALVVADRLGARVIARPLADLTAAAGGIARGDYARRVTPDDTEEIGGLGDAFNSMAARIEGDIAARERTDERLRASEAHFRLLFESNPLPMWVYDVETLAFLEVNDAARAHYGWSRDEFLAMRITDIRPESEVPRLVAELAERREPWQRPQTWTHRLKSGALIDVEITSHALVFDGRSAVLVVAQDVTERRRLEERLWQSQKLEAIGNLAGGVAHDVNNVLTVILGFTQMLREAPDMPQGHDADFGHIEGAAERAQNLTRQLLAFARRQVLQPRVFDVNKALQDVAVMMRKLIPENVALVIAPAAGARLVRLDPTQFEQILINLAVNAADAMPRGGRLTIETGTVMLDETYRARNGQIAPGRYAMIAVSDTGTGMDEQTAAHAFEPFFTTKEVGKGTGLGLATVHGIVKQSGGDIWLYSEPGHGTTFKIYLPEVTEAEQPVEASHGPRPSAGGDETILLVEDDDDVRPLVRTALERAGYVVLEAAHPKDARRVAAAHEGTIDLLLSDVVMPESDGPALHGTLQEKHPELRVLYMSGYADDAIVRQGLLVEGTPFIQKPFAPRALVAKVRETLDA